ncbi:hypothetical protein IFT48_05155 [Pseudomonas fluorescens]|uniref:hypothetical protein n=1 Tax=Pseudomonas TaxID=286 RepID=UPI000F02B557|nr:MULTISPECIES: hypothetical protein [Pseudomonas]MBD8089364.1 hypothetical protein [Pseudomonas fluorescens]MBD8615209.1 hypothetical protein [Pseudomonas putida]MBD8682137.1 hypothetical protein [Pseudomonas sp. CFBP 13719]
MNLNKQQQQLFTQLNNILKAIRSVAQDPVVVKDKMAVWIEDFEASVGADLKVRFGDVLASEIVLIDCSRDSLASSLDSTETLMVRARSEGIRIAVTAAYKDQYRHSNAAMADALEALAQQLRAVPFEVIDKGACDIHSELGVQHSHQDVEGDAGSDSQVDPVLPVDADADVPNAASDAPASNFDGEPGVLSLVQIPGQADPV